MKKMIIRKNVGGLDKPPIIIKEKDGVSYFSFPILEETQVVSHLFSTREGGVSKGMFSSMNLSFSRGDDMEAVLENFRRVAKVLDCNIEDIVCSDQTHTTNIRIISRADRGKGILFKQDYSDIDGIITDERDICLATFYADCVPVYFVDPIKKVIGLAHSGWKGTVGKISAAMVEKMQESYGCKPSDLVVAIGPSICQDCYEVSKDVAEEFQKVFTKMVEQENIIKAGKEKDKYQLDLWCAVKITLLSAGVKEENIAVTDVCTCCNSELLFSHRATAGKRGNLGAFLKLV